MACMFLRPSELGSFSGKKSHTQAFSNPLVGCKFTDRIYQILNPSLTNFRYEVLKMG